MQARPMGLFITDNIGNRKHLLRPFGRQSLTLHMCRELYYDGLRTAPFIRVFRTRDRESSISIGRWRRRDSMKHGGNLST